MVEVQCLHCLLIDCCCCWWWWISDSVPLVNYIDHINNGIISNSAICFNSGSCASTASSGNPCVSSAPSPFTNSTSSVVCTSFNSLTLGVSSAQNSTHSDVPVVNGPHSTGSHHILKVKYFYTINYCWFLVCQSKCHVCLCTSRHW